jgi:anti-sigma regulatory factor (Ser/Thr protein kinase)
MPLVVASEMTDAIHLGRDPAEVGRARRHARGTLRAWGLQGHAELAELVVSEVVTNALRHGAGPVDVCLSYGCGELRVEVHDDGAGRPVLRQATDEDEDGRGLVLLDGLLGLHGGVRGVTDDHDGFGKTVYVVIPLGAGLEGSR